MISLFQQLKYFLGYLCVVSSTYLGLPFILQYLAWFLTFKSSKTIWQMHVPVFCLVLSIHAFFYSVILCFPRLGVRYSFHSTVLLYCAPLLGPFLHRNTLHRSLLATPLRLRAAR